jgi:hypothetical protein
VTYGEAAASTVTGLARQPALLLIAVLNLVMIGGVGYAANNAREERRELRQQEDAIVKVITEMCAHGAKP